MNKITIIKNDLIKISVIILIFLVLILGYTTFYFQQQAKVVILPESNFYVIVSEENLDKLALKWVSQYCEQYTQNYVPRQKAIEKIEFTSIEVLDETNKIVQVNFEVEKKSEKSEFFQQQDWGIEQEKLISCQWVLNLVTVMNYEQENEICFITRRIRPAAYQMEVYKTSGQEEQEYNNFQQQNDKKYQDKTTDCTYKIEQNKLYITYDAGQNWKEVTNFSPDETITVKDGLYQISPEVTVLAKENGSQIVYSSNQGDTWKSINPKQEGRPRYIQFVTKEIGYLILNVDAAMGTDAIIVLKTEDAAETWKTIGYGPKDGYIRRASQFLIVNEQIGFMIEPTAGGESATLYRSEDGLKTFQIVEFPEATWQGELGENTGKWSEIYDTPQLPKIEKQRMTLVVGQGTDGDYGKTKAAYQSKDEGKTWEFIEEFIPAPEPWEG